jgi:hypothetical protein
LKKKFLECFQLVKIEKRTLCQSEKWLVLVLIAHCTTKKVVFTAPPPPNNCKFIKVLNCGEFGKFVVINGCSQLKTAKMGDNGKYLS